MNKSLIIEFICINPLKDNKKIHWNHYNLDLDIPDKLAVFNCLKKFKKQVVEERNFKISEIKITKVEIFDSDGLDKYITNWRRIYE